MDITLWTAGQDGTWLAQTFTALGGAQWGTRLSQILLFPLCRDETKKPVLLKPAYKCISHKLCVRINLITLTEEIVTASSELEPTWSGLGACLLARMLQGVLEIVVSSAPSCQRPHHLLEQCVLKTCLHLKRFIYVVKLSAGE